MLSSLQPCAIRAGLASSVRSRQLRASRAPSAQAFQATTLNDWTAAVVSTPWDASWRPWPTFLAVRPPTSNQASDP